MWTRGIDAAVLRCRVARFTIALNLADVGLGGVDRADRRARVWLCVGQLGERCVDLGIEVESAIAGGKAITTSQSVLATAEPSVCVM